jgi:hypothetical protein
MLIFKQSAERDVNRPSRKNKVAMEVFNSKMNWGVLSAAGVGFVFSAVVQISRVLST